MWPLHPTMTEGRFVATLRDRPAVTKQEVRRKVRVSRIGLCVLATGVVSLGALAPTAQAASGGSISVTAMKETNSGPVAGPVMAGDTVNVTVSGCASGVTSGTTMSKAFTSTASLSPSADRPTLQGFPTVASVAAGSYTVTATCGGASATTSITVAGSTTPTVPAKPVTPSGAVQTGVGGSVMGVNSAEAGAGAALLALTGGGLVLSFRKRTGH